MLLGNALCAIDIPINQIKFIKFNYSIIFDLKKKENQIRLFIDLDLFSVDLPAPSGGSHRENHCFRLFVFSDVMFNWS